MQLNGKAMTKRKFNYGYFLLTIPDKVNVNNISCN